MGIMFDIIGSILVRTAIVLIVLRMNVSLNTMVSETVAHSTIQQELSILRQVMSNDFEYAGLNVAPGTAFIDARLHDIRFQADLNNDGIPETVEYHRSTTTDLIHTPNPNDRRLYRQVNGGTPLYVANGITKFDFIYYDANGIQTTNKVLIKSFSINVTLQDGYPIENKYASSYWEQSFFPLNL